MIRVRLPYNVKNSVLACGTDLKGAFSLARGRTAFLINGFKDLGDLDNLTAYEKAIKTYIRKLGIRPKVIACDLHPSYFSTRFAENYQLSTVNCQLYKIQHHEAHIASAIVDNSINGKVIGVAFDGTGFGWDGNIWGGEFFIGDLKGFNRVARLGYIPMPGGEAAVREPWRMAASFLYRAFGSKFTALRIDLMKKINKKSLSILKKMIDENINAPLTSSVGRLFDAAGALILSKEKASFEAELPIELEKIIAGDCEDKYGFDIKSKGTISVIDPSKAIRSMVKDLSRGIDRSIISARFHNTISAMILDVSLRLRKRFGFKKVVLSGGVFQNRYLIDRAKDILEDNGFGVFTNSRTGTNDSGIPVGQAAIANARIRCA